MTFLQFSTVGLQKSLHFLLHNGIRGSNTSVKVTDDTTYSYCLEVLIGVSGPLLSQLLSRSICQTPTYSGVKSLLDIWLNKQNRSVVHCTPSKSLTVKWRLLVFVNGTAITSYSYFVITFNPKLVFLRD